MRRTVGLILVGLGVGLLTLGVTLRYWAYPKVAVATTQFPTTKAANAKLDPPADTTISSGNVSVLVLANGAEGAPAVRQLDVVATRTTLGDVGAASVGNVYYESRVVLTSPGVPGTKLNVTVDGICFDQVSGRATATCERKNYRSVAEAQFNDDVSFEGQVLKFPFDTKPRDYVFWDGVLGRGVPISYSGTEKLDGLTVYRFTQTIPKTTLDAGAVSLPGALFGSAAAETVSAQQVYANTRTLWIEPETGVIIKGQEDQDRHFEAAAGSVDILRGTLTYDPATVARNVAQQKSAASSLHLIRAVALPLGLIAGLILAMIGLVLALTPRAVSPRPDSAGALTHVDAQR